MSPFLNVTRGKFFVQVCARWPSLISFDGGGIKTIENTGKRDAGFITKNEHQIMVIS